MIKPIVKDVFFLGQKSDPATNQDIQTGQDLQDTLKANETRCVGMAANMIGVKKRIIIVNIGFMNLVKRLHWRTHKLQFVLYIEEVRRQLEKTENEADRMDGADLPARN